MKIKFLSLLLICLFATHNSLANSVSTKAKRPWFKSRFDSSYYDFQGRHPADGGIYGFENVNYRVQSFSFSVLATPTLEFSVVARHIRNYAETNFLGVLYKDTTEGIADTKVKATKSWFNSLGLFVADLGLSLPTGSVGEKNQVNPALNYPYNMQLGSGTFDAEPTLMYMKFAGKHQLGALAFAALRFGKNDYGYRRGNEYLGKVWYNYSFTKYFNPGMWLNYHHLQRLSGQDSTYGRNIFVEFYHSPRHFWDLTANISSEVELTKSLKLKGLLARPLWQESKNIDNVQVYMTWFAQLGLEGQF